MKYGQGKYNSDVYGPTPSPYTKDSTPTTIFLVQGDFGIGEFGMGSFGYGGNDFSVVTYTLETVATTTYTLG